MEKLVDQEWDQAKEQTEKVGETLESISQSIRSECKIKD